MEVIEIKFYGNVISCSKTYEYTGKLNTCKITQNNEFFFTLDYLSKHFDTLEFYISPLIEKNHVIKFIINDKNLLPYMKKILNNFKNIFQLQITDYSIISVSDFKEIIELKYIRDIECYDMDIKLYKQLSTKYHIYVKLNSEILFESNFMKINHIITYSDLYHKKEICIDTDMNVVDKNEFLYFMKNNESLEKIKIKKFTKNNIDYVTSILKNSKVIILLVAGYSIANSDLKYLKRIKRKNKVNLQLEYSKTYIRNNAFKQLNLNILKFSMILLIAIGFGFISMQHIIFARDKASTDDVVDITKYETIIEEKPAIEATVDEKQEPEVVVETPFVSSYNQIYNEQFSELKKINPDTIGWVKVNNTNVNYPVVQANDNEYYLNHSFDKSGNTFGWIYADYRSHFDTLNQNTILYGHNVLGTNLLFSSLEKVVEPEWYNNTMNLTITFNTEQGNMKWQIFSIYVIPVTNDYLITNFNSEASFLAFVQKLKDRSIKNFGVEVNGNDRMLTLSTCYKDSSKRVVVHAKRIS